jgi:hypothetical protein
MADEIDSAVKNAAVAGDVAMLKHLVASHGPAVVRLDGDPSELTALHLASASGNIEAVRLLLAPPVNADPRAARNNNFTPLHAAAMQGHAAVCEVLIDAGADTNVQTIPQGYAPLHSAAFAGHIDAIRVLLAHGADRTLMNYRNEQPRDTARRTGQAEAVRALMARLDFSTDSKPVGLFLDAVYPQRPGRYRYEPYRGEGHAVMSSFLERGVSVDCSFRLQDADVHFVVTQEIFIPAHPESFWFIDIQRLDLPTGVLSTDRPPHRHALLPISIRSVHDTKATPS